jgi:hypothetical protein
MESVDPYATASNPTRTNEGSIRVTSNSDSQIVVPLFDPARKQEPPRDLNVARLRGATHAPLFAELLATLPGRAMTALEPHPAPPTFEVTQTSFRSVVDRIRVENVLDLPNIVLAVAPCRSGTTSMVRLFGASGVEAYHQPLKTALRWDLHRDEEAKNGSAYQWTLPSASKKGSHILIKETLGPYTGHESVFDPLAVLQKVLENALRAAHKDSSPGRVARLLRDKVHLVVVGREPTICWSSWRRVFTGRGADPSVLLEHFVTAHKTVASVEESARRTGMKVSHFTYENVEHATTTVPALFEQLGIQHKARLDRWSELPAAGTEGSRMHLPTLPEAFQLPGVHDGARNSDGFIYFAPTGEHRFAPHESALVEQVRPIYSGWSAASKELERPTGGSEAVRATRRSRGARRTAVMGGSLKDRASVPRGRGWSRATVSA